MKALSWFRIGSILAALSVAAGAFGAHGLKQVLSPYQLGIFEKAVFYQFVHALAILILSAIWLTEKFSPKVLSKACVIFFFAILLFSGSLYLLALTGIRWLGAITPFGGIAFILGWVYLAIQAKEFNTRT